MPGIEHVPPYMLRFGAMWMHNESKTEVMILGLTSKPDPGKELKYAQRIVYRYPDGRVWSRLVDDFLGAYAFSKAEGSKGSEPRGYEVSDGIATVHLSYSEEWSREWVFGAKNEHRNNQSPSPDYQVHKLYRLADLWGEQG